MNPTIPALSAAFLYLVATLLHLAEGRRGALLPRPLVTVGVPALLLHGVASYALLATPSGVNLALWPATVLILFAVNLIVLASGLRKPVLVLLRFLYPASALLLVLGSLFPAGATKEEHLSPLLGLHVAISLTAYGLFTIATVQAVLIAFQHRRLHEHQPLGGLLRGLPPLQTMEALLFEFIGAGFVLLSLALLTGFLFVRDLWGQQLVHKTFFAILGWTVYAILLLGRVRFGWRGPTAIRFAIGGFAFLALAYWGSKLALEVILQ